MEGRVAALLLHCWGYPVLALYMSAALLTAGWGYTVWVHDGFFVFWPARHKAHAAQKNTPPPKGTRGVNTNGQNIWKTTNG
jgi:hypothetical protein